MRGYNSKLDKLSHFTIMQNTVNSERQQESEEKNKGRIKAAESTYEWME